MRRSDQRILTTHTGNLPGPPRNEAYLTVTKFDYPRPPSGFGGSEVALRLCLLDRQTRDVVKARIRTTVQTQTPASLSRHGRA
jgi:hypothetical protein